MASGAPPRAAGRYSSYSAEERLRSSADAAFNTDSQNPGMHHKRTVSANPRPVKRSFTTEERRHEERRVMERTLEAHVEKTMKRTSGSEKQHRRSLTAERRDGDIRRQKSAELRLRDSVSEAVQAPWNPEATLLPHSSAPLASRISRPPVASTVPQAPQPRPLSELTLEAQEAAIVEDLLFVLMGYEGQYIRYAKGYDPAEERDRLTGPAFRLLSGLDPSLADLAQSMLKMATYYSALEAFVDIQSRAEFGAVNHALCASIRSFLHDYLVMMAQLETQFLTSDAFTIHVLNVHTIPTRQTMHQLYLLAHELLKRNGILDDESDEEEDVEIENPDDIIERLREGGDLLPGNMASKRICKGGVVLGLITRRLETMSGDPAARALLTSLLRDASRPYMVMLNEWLHHGSIRDRHAEFLIEERKSIGREQLEDDYTDDYWDRRYTVRERDVPPQLEGVKEKVLLAGKYLNVVRECGGVDVSKVVSDVPVTFDDPRFLENVNHAYAHANASLMQLLLTTHALPARLQSLKHYFFLDPSDYFSYFLELGASELRKPIKSVNTNKLQSLLDLVLRQPGSVVSLDPFKEDVKVGLNHVTLIKELQKVVNITGIEQGEALQPLLSNQPVAENDKNATGFTSLQLDYSVPFPVSLVISGRTVWRYQTLFRYLLSLRFLESQLSATWQTQTRGVAWAHRGTNRGLEIWKRRAWTLRARMLVFVQQLLYFCTSEVIEPNWTKFMSRLSTRDGDGDGDGDGDATDDNAADNAEKDKNGGGDRDRDRDRDRNAPPPPSGRPSRTVDQLMQDHVDFLDTCLKECMLTNSKLLRIHSKLMQTCTIFANHTKWLTRELEKADADLSGPSKPATMTTDQWARFQAASTTTTTTTTTTAAPQNDQSADARLRNLSDIIGKWEHNFGRHLQILLDALNHYAATETVVLLNLCARLSAANQGTEFAGRGQEEDA